MLYGHKTNYTFLKISTFVFYRRKSYCCIQSDVQILCFLGNGKTLYCVNDYRLYFIDKYFLIPFIHYILRVNKNETTKYGRYKVFEGQRGE